VRAPLCIVLIFASQLVVPPQEARLIFDVI